MIDLKDTTQVKAVQSSLHVAFDSDAGKEVLRFLEQLCGWYESVFSPVNRDIILVNAGRREVLATIKTMLKCSPEEISALARAQEE